MIGPEAKEATLQKLEEKIIKRLVRECRAAGFKPVYWFDSWPGEGEYQDAQHRSATEVVKVIDTTDLGTLHFAPIGRVITKPADLENFGVFLVLGNGVDVISDWHCQDEAFNAAVEKAADYAMSWEAA